MCAGQRRSCRAPRARRRPGSESRARPDGQEPRTESSRPLFGERRSGLPASKSCPPRDRSLWLRSRFCERLPWRSRHSVSPRSAYVWRLPSWRLPGVAFQSAGPFSLQLPSLWVGSRITSVTRCTNSATRAERAPNADCHTAPRGLALWALYWPREHKGALASALRYPRTTPGPWAPSSGSHE
jgi:hypothetical protein